MNRSATVRPFGLRDKVGYLFGDFGNDFTFVFSTMMLMKFYTDVMGVSAGIVGLVMTIARIVDAFTDVTMGRICDRARTTPNGKFKPWLLRMCGPVAIASFLIYQSALAGLPMGAKIAYLFVTYILWGSVFYTSVNIPYGSMASAISADPDDRQSLSTFRTMAGADPAIFQPFKELSKFFIILAMAAIGINTDLVKLIKNGSKPIFMGACCWAGITAASLLMQHLEGLL